MHIPTLEPLQIPHAELDTGATFKAIFKNIHVFGLTSFNIRNISMNLDGNVVDLDLQFPFVRTTADYSIKGRLLILQLNGFGKCQGSYSKYLLIRDFFADTTIYFLSKKVIVIVVYKLL